MHFLKNVPQIYFCLAVYTNFLEYSFLGKVKRVTGESLDRAMCTLCIEQNAQFPLEQCGQENLFFYHFLLWEAHISQGKSGGQSANDFLMGIFIVILGVIVKKLIQG